MVSRNVRRVRPDDSHKITCGVCDNRVLASAVAVPFGTTGSIIREWASGRPLALGASNQASSILAPRTSESAGRRGFLRVLESALG